MGIIYHSFDDISTVFMHIGPTFTVMPYDSIM